MPGTHLRFDPPQLAAGNGVEGDDGARALQRGQPAAEERDAVAGGHGAHQLHVVDGVDEALLGAGAGLVGPERPATLGVRLRDDQHQPVLRIPADIQGPVLRRREVRGLVDGLAAARVVRPDALRAVLARVQDAIDDHGVLGLARGLQVYHLTRFRAAAGYHAVAPDVDEAARRPRCP